MDGERTQIMNETLEILSKVDVDGLRDLGLGWLASAVDNLYYDIQETMNAYEEGD